MNGEMNEQAAIAVIKEYVAGDLYILLSSVNANMIGGFSFPYVGQMEKGKILFLFSDLNYAREYCDNQGYEVIDGVYPLSKIEKGNKPFELEMILKIASHLGIEYLDINPGHEAKAFGVRIPWMQKVLGYDLNDISVILSDQEMEMMKAKKDGRVPLRFNPLRIYEYSNPYAILAERKNEIDKLPFNCGETVKDYVDIIKLMPLNELIYFSEILNRKYVTEAKQRGDQLEVSRLTGMYSILDQVIINCLLKIRVYTLLDNDEILIVQNKAAYILYTERFKYMGEYRYKEVELADFCEKLEKKGINSLIITAGPGEKHLGTVSSIQEFIKINGQ